MELEQNLSEEYRDINRLRWDEEIDWTRDYKRMVDEFCRKKQGEKEREYGK